ncbi:MAG: hypothetical protein KatS3mg108_2602 [Isosphaeraceae bacterium]|nr:MAG: hypothetical protein KatS3mg108_2602 [Isosphaeraceae bacterium]
MRTPDIENFAKSTLIALDMWRLPVNPFAIVKEEGIELAPGRYGPKFDARIEFVGAERAFILYYRTAQHGRTESRVRFSLAHELAHFYLPSHREYLLSGRSHNSVIDFRSRNPRENEADEFASALLMPRELFLAEMDKRRRSFWTLSDLCRLADEEFQTSVTSTVRRYCQFDFEPCAMVVSEANRVNWAWHSDSMRALGMSHVPAGSRVPGTSRTAGLWKRLEGSDSLDAVGGLVPAQAWYERPYREELWEEAMPLGYTGLVLTYLTLQDPGSDD